MAEQASMPRELVGTLNWRFQMLLGRVAERGGSIAGQDGPTALEPDV